MRKYTDEFGQEWMDNAGVPIDVMTKRIMVQECADYLRAHPELKHTYSSTGDTFMFVERKPAGPEGAEQFEVRELSPVRVAFDYKVR